MPIQEAVMMGMLLKKKLVYLEERNREEERIVVDR